MKKTTLLTCMLLITSLAITAQDTQKKQATVRIKKVENINGVEKVTDTTYTTDDANVIINGDKAVHIVTENINNDNGVITKTIVIDDHDKKGEPTIKVKTGDPKKDALIEKEWLDAQKNGKMNKIIIMNEDGGSGATVKMIGGDKELNEEIKKAMEEARKSLKEAEKNRQAAEKDMKSSQYDHKASEEALKEAEKALIAAEKELKEIQGDCKTLNKVIIIDDDANEKDKGEKKVTRIIMLKMKVADASDEDMKRLKNQLGTVDNKVEMENMKLYPNPNDGKFNLNFNLKNKGDAEITVYNVEGKQVYSEKLPDFQGEYNKPIDISNNAKGIYFVKIRQGDHTQVKKISLD